MEGKRGGRGIQRWNLLFEAKWIVNQCLLDILLVRYCSVPLENISLNPIQQELIVYSIADKNFKSKHRPKLSVYFQFYNTAFSNFDKKITFLPREMFEAKTLHFL